MARKKKRTGGSPARAAAPTRVDLVDQPLPELPPAAEPPVLNNRWDALLALEDLATAAAEAARLRDLGVERAREAGASWVSIGEALGVTRQAARQRYSR